MINVPFYRSIERCYPSLVGVSERKAVCCGTAGTGNFGRYQERYQPQQTQQVARLVFLWCFIEIVWIVKNTLYNLGGTLGKFSPFVEIKMIIFS